uniref:Uncharacterized protein n=1 Tax=Arundo donax TaxID=35708 RepID=A0A0A8ZPW7_ARUDO
MQDFVVFSVIHCVFFYVKYFAIVRRRKLYIL